VKYIVGGHMEMLGFYGAKRSVAELKLVQKQNQADVSVCRTRTGLACESQYNYSLFPML